jgi:tetratricopeptide (TPR) repeat protein
MKRLLALQGSVCQRAASSVPLCRATTTATTITSSVCVWSWKHQQHKGCIINNVCIRSMGSNNTNNNSSSIPLTFAFSTTNTTTATAATNSTTTATPKSGAVTAGSGKSVTTDDAVTALIGRAQRLSRLNNRDEAVQLLNVAVKMKPNNWLIHFEIAMCYIRAANPGGRHQSSSPSSTSSGSNDNESKKSDSSLALPHLDKCLTLSLTQAQQVVVMANRAGVLYDMQRYQEALQSYESILKLIPDHLESCVKAGSIYHSLSRYDDALTMFNKVIPESSSTVSSSSSSPSTGNGIADALLQRATLYNTLERYSDAMGDLTRAISMDNKHIPTLMIAARTLMKMDEPNEALKYADRAQRLARDDVNIMMARAEIFTSLERPKDALKVLDAIILRQPNEPAPHFHRGTLLDQLDFPDEALMAFDQALAVCADYHTITLPD